MRKQRHWQIVIYPEQYDDDDDHGYSWVGTIPGAVCSDTEASAYAKAAAIRDCEITNDWEEGEIDHDCGDSDDHAGVEAALRATVGSLKASSRAHTPAELEAAMVDALEGWEHDLA